MVNRALPGRTFPVIKYYYVFEVKYAESILSNGTRKLLLLVSTALALCVAGDYIDDYNELNELEPVQRYVHASGAYIRCFRLLTPPEARSM